MTEQANRWKYSAHKVTVGENHQHVRSFTSGDRKKFAMKSREIREKKADANDLPLFIVSLAAINPTLTVEEAEEMPPELLDACVAKIMELTGFKDEDTTADEKKVLDQPPTSS